MSNENGSKTLIERIATLSIMVIFAAVFNIVVFRFGCLGLLGSGSDMALFGALALLIVLIWLNAKFITFLKNWMTKNEL